MLSKKLIYFTLSIVVANIILSVIFFATLHAWHKTINAPIIGYDNNEYGFSLDVPRAWQDYQVRETSDPFIPEVKGFQFGFEEDGNFIHIFSVIATPRDMWPAGDEYYESRKSGENSTYIFMTEISGDAIPAQSKKYASKLNYIREIQKSFSTFHPQQ